MTETAKARVAWNDYLAMGAERSLEKLLGCYQSATDSVPTRRIGTIKKWSVIHGWQARLTEIAAQERAAIVAHGIADRQNRVNALGERWELMKRVIQERAGAEEMQAIAGGKTGLLAHDVKGVGKGEDFRLVDVYEVDTGLLKEMRAHEEQAAKELGQWIEKQKVELVNAPEWLEMRTLIINVLQPYPEALRQLGEILGQQEQQRLGDKSP